MMIEAFAENEQRLFLFIKHNLLNMHKNLKKYCLVFG